MWSDKHLLQNIQKQTLWTHIVSEKWITFQLLHCIDRIESLPCQSYEAKVVISFLGISSCSSMLSWLLFQVVTHFFKRNSQVFIPLQSIRMCQTLSNCQHNQWPIKFSDSILLLSVILCVSCMWPRRPLPALHCLNKLKKYRMRFP